MFSAPSTVNQANRPVQFGKGFIHRVEDRILAELEAAQAGLRGDDYFPNDAYVVYQLPSGSSKSWLG